MLDTDPEHSKEYDELESRLNKITSRLQEIEDNLDERLDPKMVVKAHSLEHRVVELEGTSSSSSSSSSSSFSSSSSLSYFYGPFQGRGVSCKILRPRMKLYKPHWNEKGVAENGGKNAVNLLIFILLYGTSIHSTGARTIRIYIYAKKPKKH